MSEPTPEMIEAAKKELQTWDYSISDAVANAALTAALAAQWQPIATAPRDERAILIGNGSTFPICAAVAYWDSEAEEPYRWHVEDAAKGFNYHRDWPTHWMPLPEPPKETK